MKITDLCDDILELISQNAVDIRKKIKSKRQYQKCLTHIELMNPLWYNDIPTNYDDEYYISAVLHEVLDCEDEYGYRTSVLREMKLKKIIGLKKLDFEWRYLCGFRRRKLLKQIKNRVD